MPYKDKNAAKLRAKRYYIENKEKICTQTSTYKKQNRKTIQKKNKIYCEAHKEEKRSYDQKYREKNKEKIRKQKEEYRYKNLDRIKQISKEYRSSRHGKFIYVLLRQKRRALGKNLQNTLTLQEWQEILQNQNNRCVACDREFGEHLKPTKDHIVPLSKSSDVGLTKENTQALCISCNSAKRDKIFTHEEYVRWVQKRRNKYKENND